MTPRAWAIESPAQAERLVMRESAAGRALVLKPLFGSQGKGLALVGSVQGEHRPLPRLDGAYGGLAYLQRFVPPLTNPGFDWRVLVIGGRAVAAMRRVSEHWIHNVAQGARVEAAELTPALARLAENAARTLDLDYAGIDILPADAAAPLQVIEVNGIAAWQGLQRVTPFNVARALVDDLLDRKLAAQRAARSGARRA